MMAFTVKSFLPRGLYGRAALILIVPVATLVLVVSVVFVQRHYESVARQMTRALVAELTLLSSVVEDEAARGSDPLGTLQAGARALEFEVAPAVAAPSADRRAFYDFSGRAAIRVLRAELGGVRAVELTEGPSRVHVWWQSPAGLVRLEVPRARISATNPHQLLVLMLFTGLLMTAISFQYLRNQLKPIALLASAAEAFGRGEVVPYRVRGATEVRAAGAAFLEMRARIERQIEQRTLMLTGVSHDLRTPLTRMRLGLAMLEQTEETAALRGDVAEMERMIDDFLAFARGTGAEAARRVALPDFVAGVIERAARAGRSALLLAPTALPELEVQPDALGRAIENLIANANRHAAHTEVTLGRDGDMIVIAVEDDGPGIPEEQRAEALRPFTRLGTARDPNSGGVGLGLAIAESVARAHGGRLVLDQSARMGGLRAELRLPLGAAGHAHP